MGVRPVGIFAPMLISLRIAILYGLTHATHWVLVHFAASAATLQVCPALLHVPLCRIRWHLCLVTVTCEASILQTPSVNSAAVSYVTHEPHSHSAFARSRFFRGQRPAASQGSWAGGTLDSRIHGIFLWILSPSLSPMKLSCGRYKIPGHVGIFGRSRL